MALYAGILYIFNYPITVALTDSFVSNLLLCGVCLLITTTYQHYIPGPQRYSFHFAFAFVLTLLWFLASRFILKLILSKYQGYENIFTTSTPLRIAVAFLVIGCMILVSVLWFTLQSQQEEDRRKTETARLAKEAELLNLRQQLQPHFLFNSLNSINALIGLKPEQARTMIQQLSDFLRGTLRKDDQQRVTLEEELAHLQLYLEIEKVRFGYRLNTVIEMDDKCKTMLMPAMLLQPVVENAIKFGLYDTVEPVTICINAKEENGKLIVTVTNPYDPETSVPKKGTGFGLSSVQRRLYLVFAQQGLLQTSANENLFTTTMTIPQPV